MSLKNDLEKAVAAMQVYLGSVGRTYVRDEDRLYRRVRRAVSVIADKTKMDEENVWQQIEDEARRRGTRLAMPGKDV